MTDKKHEQKKKPHDLREGLTPVSITPEERKDPLGETPATEIYESNIATPGVGNVPEGQTTKE